MIKVHSKDSGTSGSIKLTVNASSIIEFTLIDDKDNDLTQVEVVKYVNLPVDGKFIDASNGIVTGTHQLGNDIWCKVKFSKPGEYSFDILLKNDNAVAYTQSEKDRNVNFTHRRALKITDVTNSAGEIIVKGADLFLSQAGGNTYTLNVEFNGEDKVTCKTKILTKRMLFFSEIKMESPDGSSFLPSINNDISNLVHEYRNHHIELVKSFETAVKYIPNIDTPLDLIFMRNVETAYTNIPGNKLLDPFCLAITYTGPLAVKTSAVMVNLDIPVGPGEGPAMIDVTNSNMRYQSLWNKIDYPDEVNRNEWYVICTYKMTKKTNGAAVTDNQIMIPHYKCTPISLVNNPDNCCVVCVDVSHLPSGVADITLMVNTVSMMRGGISFGGTNIVCLCTKVWWRVFSTAEQNLTILHEVGHRVGMVPDGTGKSLDMGANYYVDRGHNGPHCHSGISPNITADYLYDYDDDANCIMYGNIIPTRNRFCDDCKSKIKKADLSKGIDI